MNTDNYTVSSFYKFVNLPNFLDLKSPFLNFMNTHNLLGTIIMAEEGINGSICGSADEIQYFYDFLRQYPCFEDITFTETFSESIPFTKAKVKLRKEIVTMGIPGINPARENGTYLSAPEWNSLIQDPDVLVIDTRNEYEIYLGTFKNAINPHTQNFREFPEYVQKNLMDKKDKKIAMCCTGGIRCEKSTAYLKSLGFNEVYHLKGGILNYLENIPKNESLWEGTCFVFDDRIAVSDE